MNSYWDATGEHQALADALLRFVPLTGEVENPKANPKLERFRKAVRVYHDIFNNGGCNTRLEIHPTFGIFFRDYQRERGSYPSLDFDRLKADLEGPMSGYVLAAAAEQLARLPEFLDTGVKWLNRLPPARENHLD